MGSVERHINRHTLVLSLSLLALVGASVAFLLATVPLIVTAFGMSQPAAAECGCGLVAATLPPTVIGLLSAFALLAVIFLARFIRAVISSLIGTSRVRSWLQRLRLPTSSTLATLATRTGLANRVTLVSAFPEGLMTVGLFRPRVFLSKMFTESMESDELEAALRHEAAHVRRRDPLRQFLTVVLESTLGFVPPIRRAVHSFRAEVELAADAAASASYANTDALSRAFVKALSFGGHRVRPIAATALSVTDDRLEQLLNPRRPIVRHIPSLIVLAVSLVVSFGLFAVHGVAARSETTATGAGEQCHATPRCVTQPMSTAPHFSTESGMCTGGVCFTTD